MVVGGGGCRDTIQEVDELRGEVSFESGRGRKMRRKVFKSGQSVEGRTYG